MSISDQHLVLHIGPGKTGTTALQRSFPRYESFLAERDFAARTLQDDYEFVMRYFTPWRFGIEQSAVSLEDTRRRLEAELAAIPARNIILSSEYMTGSMLNPKLINLVKTERLTRSFRSREIVFYLRRQDSMYESIFQQQYKNGESPGYDEYRRSNDPGILDYARRLKAVEELFPGARIHVRPYELMISGRDILRDFLRTVGIVDLPDDIRSRKSNLSFTREALVVLNTCQRRFPERDYNRIRRFLGEEMAQTRSIQNKGYGYLSNEERREIMARHEAGNRWIFKRFKLEKDLPFDAWNALPNDAAAGEDGSDPKEDAVALLARALLDRIDEA